MKRNFFNRHINDSGETYFEHFLFSASIALWIIYIGIMHLIHSIFPFIFATKAGKNIKKINDIMQKRYDYMIKKINQDKN